MSKPQQETRDMSSWNVVLRSMLVDRQPGPVDAELEDQIMQILSADWDGISGATAAAMNSGKLDRREDMSWDPPNLSFRIERHGGMAFGSTRAELQRWTANLDTGEVRCSADGYRQLRERAAVFKHDQVASELLSSVAMGRGGEGINFLSPSRVEVTLKAFLPPGAKETMNGRRRRLKQAIIQQAKRIGWSSEKGVRLRLTRDSTDQTS